MRVDQVNTQVAQGLGFEKPDYKGHHVEDADPSPKARISESLSDEQGIEQPIETAEEGEGVKGVLRLLQEGHFKGVADVRLRINFHDELAAIEGTELRAVAEENISGLSESIQPTMDTLVGTGQITQEQADEMMGTFQRTVNQSVENFLTGQLSKDALAGKLNSGFSAFLASLTAATNQIVTVNEGTDENIPAVDEILEEVVAEEVISEQIGQEEQTQSPGFVDELTAAFNAGMEQFIAGLNDVTILPELSSPNGNGSAYQKFLDIYNELYGFTNVEKNDDTVSLDAVT